MLLKNCYKSYKEMEKETGSGKRKVEMVILRAQVRRKTEVITAVWRNSWFCLSWKILCIFQFGFSKIFFLNCR